MPSVTTPSAGAFRVSAASRVSSRRTSASAFSRRRSSAPIDACDVAWLALTFIVASRARCSAAPSEMAAFSASSREITSLVETSSFARSTS